MTLCTTTQNVEWFIDTVLLGDIKKMICTHHQHYLGFGVVACAIEFLGACMDNKPFDALGESRQRFESALNAHFARNYHPYADHDSPYDLYKHLRCGMAHIMRPQGKVVFTHHAESVNEGTRHLQMMTTTQQLVLVSECLYKDFAEACNKLKQQMAARAYSKKLSDAFLVTSGS